MIPPDQPELPRARGFSNEPPQNPQIAGVEVFAILDSLGCFQNHGQIPEPRIIDEMPERFQSHASGPDRRVAINAAAAIAAAIVHVPDAQAAQPDCPVELVDSLIVLFLVARE